MPFTSSARNKYYYEIKLNDDGTIDFSDADFQKFLYNLLSKGFTFIARTAGEKGWLDGDKVLFAFNMIDGDLEAEDIINTLPVNPRMRRHHICPVYSVDGTVLTYEDQELANIFSSEWRDILNKFILVGPHSQHFTEWEEVCIALCILF